MTLPVAAFAAAVIVTVWAVPGVKLSVAGCAVAPAGSPAIATATVPANEFTAATATLTPAPAPPATTVADAGDTASVKSGAGAARVAATVAEWLSAPEVPVKVTMTLPAAAFAAAAIVTVCAVPGIKLSVAGCAVTPAGSPAIETFTIPIKPLDGTALTLIC
jgi:hypothetical protein